jgi:hypothetical protein
VQESKKNTLRILESGTLPSPPGPLAEGDGKKTAVAFRQELEEFLDRRRPRDYVALMAYLPCTPAAEASLQELQGLLRDRTQLAATLGFGPRFLHSTGQFHKGGPNTGLFIQLTGTPHHDHPIPGLPSTCGALIRAQAQGDLEALRQSGRRVLRLELGTEPERNLAELVDLFREETTT